MKNCIITAVTVFALAAGTAYAGEPVMDMNNAFSYSKSTQSAGSAASAGSTGSVGSGPSTGLVVFLALVLVVGLIAANSGGSNHTKYKPK